MTKSEAETELFDRLMWGEKYMGYDLIRVLDGEDLNPLVQLTAERRHDEALEFIGPFVKRFVESETGQKLVYSLIADQRESEKLSVLEARAELLYQEA